MGPGHNRFWLPLTRLGAFFVGVVVIGNVVFDVFRPAAADLTQVSDERVDYYAKKKRRLERQIFRTLEKFLGGTPVPTPPPASAPAKEKPVEREKVGAMPPAASPVVYLLASDVIPTPPISAPIAKMTPPNHVPGPAALAFIEPEPLPFVWPAPLEPAVRADLPMPLSLSLAESHALRAEMVMDLYRRSASDPLADVGDTLLKGPEMLLDGIVILTGGMSERVATRTWQDEENRCVMARILDVQIGPRNGRIFMEFMNQWTDREGKYLANFDESRVATVGFQDRTEAANMAELALDQRKVFWDALRRTYMARYKMSAEERVRDEAWYFDRWKSYDFVFLPPLLGAYVWYRGLDKRISMGDTSLRISIEPVSEWVHRNHNLAGAAGIEWSIKGVPLSVIVSAGLHDGRYGVDFVGIGTSIAAARRALSMLDEGERR